MFIIQKLFIEHLLYLCTFLDVDAILVNKTEKIPPSMEFIYMEIFHVYMYILFFSFLPS